LLEPYGWLFVENVPLLFDRSRIAKQLKVETWLDLTELLDEIKDTDANKRSSEQAPNYVV
jgi:hypothetical protein